MAWVIAVTVLTILGLLWIFQRSLIYLPSGSVPDPPSGVERVTFATDDGLTLTAWHLALSESRGTVLVFNGNAGNRSHRLPLGRALAEAGYSVLLTDYRGYGGNPGSPSEEGLAADARAALSFVSSHSDGHPVIYYGESLGAGVAVGLAAEEPPAALVLRSPFGSLPEVASVHYPWIPASLLARDRFPNVDRIPEIAAPVLVIAGAADDIVPLEQSRRVYEAASEPKTLLVVDGAGHNDPALLDGAEMIGALVRFLDETLK